MTTLKTLGMIAAVMLPLWNIPLIVRLQRRRSSRDMSLAWALGVWACLVIMLPSGLVSPDPIFRAYSVVNILLFTAVTIQIVRYYR